MSRVDNRWRTSFHGRPLFSAGQLGNPVGSGWSEQFDIWLRIVQLILAIEHTNFDDLHSGEVVTVPVQSRATFAAKVAVDGLAAVCSLGVDLGFTSHFEIVTGNHIVDTVCATADFLTVGTVAEGLF